MKNPQWVRTPRTGPTVSTPIVSRIDTTPPLEALSAGNPVDLKNVRANQPIHFSLDIIVEPTSRHGKVAYVPASAVGGVNFQIHSDEGKAIGADETAPSPIAYFTAGVGFCLMSHITGFLSFTNLQVRGIKIEVRGNFWTTLGHVRTGGQGEGGCDSFETYVLLDSDEPPEKLAELIAVCERACIASQTIANSVPASVKLVVNGKELSPEA